MAELKNGGTDEATPQSPEQEKLLLEGETKTCKATIYKPSAESCTNGDAKIELGTAALAGGLKKEELLKFANDPFWVRLRWILFILFWLTWLAMLAGAIFIVVVAPKCPAPEPRLWWEKGQIAVVDVAKADGGISGLNGKLNDLKGSTAGLLVRNLLKSDASGVIDYQAINPTYGTFDEYKTFSAKAASLGIKVVLGININHVSIKHPWFIKSKNQTGDFADYFVWKDGLEGKSKPPNNWLAVNSSVSAWEYDNTRKQFYYHQFGVNQPDLNLGNVKLQKELKSILRFWRGNGIAGFLFQEASYLVEDPSFTNEIDGRQPSEATFKDYNFYDHARTKNLPENVEILKIFKDELLTEMDEPNNKIIFAAEVDGPPQELAKFYGDVKPPVVELPLNRLAAPVFQTAESFRSAISQLINSSSGYWPNWLLTSDSANPGLAATLALLPGSFIYQPDDTQNFNSSIFDAMKKIQSEREAPSIMYGGLNASVVDGSVLAYTRTKTGNPGFIVLFNPGAEAKNVSVKDFEGIPSTLSVVFITSEHPELAPKSKVDSANIPVPVKEAIVLTFVPQK
ncbi:neutral and basic amino acid transport protein rBAT [Neocloeon triangulifer]|uniref:neutral and basic amino acid transport protein rBAT n=1 Tax=Neocloeon triangulifer TaxID=2078957 RepID=UPI00286F6098|nr:neutral and basic amino acid transport protein rBAT [Neocloeon triangulifer]